MSQVILPTEFVPSERSYHMAWSMPATDRAEEPSPMGKRPHMMPIEAPGSAFGRWLGEFRDERTGLASPPPMN